MCAAWRNNNEDIFCLSDFSELHQGEGSLLAEIFYVIPSIAAIALLLFVIVKPLESCFEHRVSKDNHLICIIPLEFDAPKLEQKRKYDFHG